MSSLPKLRATNSEPLIFFPLSAISHQSSLPLFHRLSFTQALTTQSSSQPTNLYLCNSTPLYIRSLQTPTHQSISEKQPTTNNTQNETPHPQLPHLRPQSLQTRNRSFSLAPTRRRTRTRGPRLESRVFGQCVAEIRLEGHQEFS